MHPNLDPATNPRSKSPGNIDDPPAPHLKHHSSRPSTCRTEQPTEPQNLAVQNAPREITPVMLVDCAVYPGEDCTVEEVLRACGRRLGGRAFMLPCGEIAPTRVCSRHPGPRPVSDPSAQAHSRLHQRHARAETPQHVELGDPTVPLRPDDLGYATDAIASYQTFRQLRRDGAIPPDVRFQIGLPGPESATRPVVRPGPDFEALWTAHVEALTLEITHITTVIPPSELAIQLDLSGETAACEAAAQGNVDVEFDSPHSHRRGLPTDPFARLALALRKLGPAVPPQTWLGLHVCAGTLNHPHPSSAEPTEDAPDVADVNLSTAVRMLNTGVAHCPRYVDYVHTPVPLGDHSETRYRPLADLEIGSAQLYLGLIDPYDGIDGALHRTALASRCRRRFGLAAPGGWGRRQAGDTLDSLLVLHATIAEHAAAAYARSAP